MNRIWTPGRGDVQDDEPLKLCPVCDLLHKHEVVLVVERGETPEVHCPCPTCKSNGLTWDTEKDYNEVWLPENIAKIEAQAEAARVEEVADDSPNKEDAEWADKVDSLVEEQAWNLKKEKRDGTFDAKKRDPWEGQDPNL